MMTADVRQALLQCPGEGHISAPVQCDKRNQQGQTPIHGKTFRAETQNGVLKCNIS